MTKKPGGLRPWWLNTYFHFGGLLFVLALVGFIRGPRSIHDPGQPFVDSLAWLYLAAAGIFFVNGFLSHSAYLRERNEAIEGEKDA